MGDIADGFNSAFRDFETDGVPSSGPHKPSKPEIRSLGPEIEQEIAIVSEAVSVETQRARDAESALGQRIDSTVSSGNIGANTLSALNALAVTLGLNNTTDRGKVGRVFNDGSNTGYYTWSGTAWVFGKPDDIAAAQTAADIANAKASSLLDMTGDTQTIGVTSPVAGSQATALTYVHAKEVEGDGIVTNLQLWCMVASQITVAVFTRSAADLFSRVQLFTTNVVPGLNDIKLGLPVLRGQYLGLTGVTTGFIAYGATNNIGYFDGTLAGGTFTDTVATRGNALQIKFSVELFNAPVKSDLVSDSMTTTQYIGTKTTPITGTSASAGTLVPATPAANDGVIDFIEVFCVVGVNLTMGIYERNGYTMTRVETLARVTTYTGLNTYRIRRPIKKGQYIGYQCDTAGWTGVVAAANDGYYYDPATTGASFTQQFITGTGNQVQVRSKIDRLNSGTKYKIGLADVDRILGIGPSYLAGYYNMQGKNWLSKVSLMSDWNIEGFGFGGETISSLLGRIRSGDVGVYAPITVKQMKPTYAFINEGWNSANSVSLGVSFDAYKEDIKQMIETMREIGAVPILASEFQPVYDASAHVVYKSLAQEMNAMFCDLVPHYLRMNNGTPYSNFWQDPNATRHPGVRTNHIISDQVERYFAQLGRPRNAIKIFRKRSTVTVSDINVDLSFRDNYERAKAFKELLLNQVALTVATENYYDELTTGAGSYSQSLVIQSEYLNMQLGKPAPIADYGLVEVTIDATVSNVQWLTFAIGDSSIAVYVKDAFVSPYPADGLSVCKWTQLVGVNGLYTLGMDDLAGRMNFDKISFLLYKSGGFTLNEPKVEWFGKAGKPAYPITISQKAARGTELLAKTTTETLTGWTVEGTLSPDLSTTYQLPYGTTGLVTVNATNKLRQNLTYTIDNLDDREVEIRVTCRRFPAIFASGGSYPGSAPINQDTFDWRKVVVEMISGSFTMQQTGKVGLWWDEVVFRSILPMRIAPGVLSIRVGGDDSIQVAKVSVKLVDA